MDIKLDITPEKIQEQITKSLIDSAIGNQIVKAIEDSVKPKWGEKDIIKEAVQSQVSLIVRQIIIQEYTDVIREKIKIRLQEEDIVSKFTTDYIDKICQIDWSKI